MKLHRWMMLAAALVFAAGASARPLVAILADARGTVATDVLAPYAILAESGAIDVRVVAAGPEPVRLLPGEAWLLPQATLAELARERAPDVVIVPAMSVVDDAERADWLRRQLRAGVQIMAVCNGARVLAGAGLLDGRQATVHWYSRGDMRRQHPRVAWRQDLRWVTDGLVTTTAGMSAAEPATLELLRRLAGEAAMRETAAHLAMPLPQQAHAGEDYRLTLDGATLVTANRLAFWRHEDVAVPLAPGFDELAFGTALDAWSRTYRSTAWVVGAPEIVSRHGLRIRPSAKLPAHFQREVALPEPDAMANTFAQIRDSYGEPTARFVALQFEHPYGAVGHAP